jgi:hypothetical protein
MKRLAILFSIFSSGFSFSFPMENIYKNLDVTTFNSSFLRKVPENKTNFSDVSSLPKPIFTDSTIVMEKESWVYKIKVYKTDQQDFYICFSDRSKKSSYNSQEPMVIRKYGERYVAIRLYSDVCEDFAR